MTFYYCNCSGSKRNVTAGRSKFERVEADDEGICAKCGYYAVSVPREAKSSTDIYYMTIGFKDGDEKRNNTNRNQRNVRKGKAGTGSLDV